MDALGIGFGLPDRTELEARLPSIHEAIYGVFAIELTTDSAERASLGGSVPSHCSALSLSTVSIGQHLLYSQRMLTIASRVDVMNRLGRAMADPTRSRILLSLLESPGYPAQLARDLDLTRTNVSNHLSCLRGCGIVAAEAEGRQTRYEISDPHISAALSSLLDVTLAVDENAPCLNPSCTVPGCCETAPVDDNAGKANV